MGRTNIAWSEMSWNPVTGCSKVSPGCAHCFAERMALTRLTGKPGYPGLPWTPENAHANVVLRPDRLDQPLRWRKPRRIFVNSMSDLFHEQVPYDFLDRVFAIMAAAPQHSFQVLTKRPDRMASYTSFARGRIETATAAIHLRGMTPGYTRPVWPSWPLPNVWLGTSVENQRWADERIPHLLATPAAVRFLSMEPLLGPIDLVDPVGRWLMRRDSGIDAPSRVTHFTGEWPLDWVIVGGESGPGHRPMRGEWVRDIRDRCVAADIPFFFKQWGGRTPKANGRMLDGRTWDEYPA